MLLPLDQRKRSQIFVSGEEQVEGKEDEVIGFPFRQGGLKRCEVGRSVFIERTDLAIDQTIGEPSSRCRDCRPFLRPVQTFAGFERHIAAFHPHLDPVTVARATHDLGLAVKRKVTAYLEISTWATVASVGRPAWINRAGAGA